MNTVKRALGWLCAIHVRVREDGVMEEIRRVPIGSGDPLICRAALLNDDDSPTPTKLIPATVTLSDIKSPGYSRNGSLANLSIETSQYSISVLFPHSYNMYIAPFFPLTFTE